MKKGIILLYSGIIVGFIIFVILCLKSFELGYFNEKYYKVPDLKSYTYEEARNIIENSGLNIKEVGGEFSSYPIGQIFLQEPEAGDVVKKGRCIKVWISKGNALVDMPDLTGMNFLDAKSLAEEKGMKIGKVITVKDGGKYNEVLATDPVTGTLLTKGEKISFLVNGAENIIQVKVPDIIGLTIEEARDKLLNSSLILGNIEYNEIDGIEKNVVIKTNIQVGEKIAAGSAIDVVVSK